MRHTTHEKRLILAMIVCAVIIALLLTWRLVQADAPTPDPNVGGGGPNPAVPMWQPSYVVPQQPVDCYQYWDWQWGWQITCQFNSPAYSIQACPSNAGYYGGGGLDGCGYPDFTQSQIDAMGEAQAWATYRYETQQADTSRVITPVSTQLAPAVVPTVQAIFPWQDGWRLLP